MTINKLHVNNIAFWTLGQIMNNLIYKMSPMSGIVSYQPLSVTIDVTTICNFSCINCSTLNYREGFGPANLSLERFCWLLKHFPKTRNVSISGAGEPLLNPHIFDMVKYARNKHNTLLTTNGSLTFSKYDELLKFPPSILEISLKGGAPDEYKSISSNNGNIFYEIINNIKNIIYNRKSKRAPIVSLSYVCDKFTINNLLRISEIAQECNVNELWLYNLIPNEKKKNENICLYTEDNNYIQRILKIVRCKAPSLKIRPPQLYSRNNFRYKCKMPFSNLRIGVCGSISGCGRALDVNSSYGNVFKDLDVFNNPYFQKLRNSFLSDTLPLRYECRFCAKLR